MRILQIIIQHIGEFISILAFFFCHRGSPVFFFMELNKICEVIQMKQTICSNGKYILIVSALTAAVRCLCTHFFKYPAFNHFFSVYYSNCYDHYFRKTQ